MVYLDTSVLVSALTRELKTAGTQAWLASQEIESLAISELVITEFSAALSIKLRTSQITADLRADALGMFHRMTADALTVFAIQGSHFRAAARLADDHELGLRAGDALHLAITSEYGAELCTLDRRLATAGSALGVRTRLL